jgi:hypothetical protein
MIITVQNPIACGSGSENRFAKFSAATASGYGILVFTFL